MWSANGQFHNYTALHIFELIASSSLHLAIIIKVGRAIKCECISPYGLHHPHTQTVFLLEHTWVKVQLQGLSLMVSGSESIFI